jgi:hypothetical protein
VSVQFVDVGLFRVVEKVHYSLSLTCNKLLPCMMNQSSPSRDRERRPSVQIANRGRSHE